VTFEEETQELMALREHFSARGITPPDAVVLMTMMISGVVGTISLTEEQRENGISSLKACAEMLETTQ
jgi:hypothetical protein